MVAFLVAALLLGVLVVAVSAQVATPLVGLEIETAGVQYLNHLQESWLQWMGAFYQDRPEEARASAEEIRGTLELLGFEALPDLSIGAAVRAMEAARQGNYERAHLGIEAAERLDPGRPETSFARAVLAWEQGEKASAGAHHLAGWARLFRISAYRHLWLQNLTLGALATVLLAGAAFVLVAAAVRGRELYQGIAGLLGARMPPPLLHTLVWVLLLWPLVLPGGLVWWFLYLSTLLWGSSSGSQRAVIASLWLVAGLAPVVVEAQVRKVEIALSPPAKAVGSLVDRRLYGGFFSDLGALRSVLPESPNVLAVLGDLHRGMAQWEAARHRYEQVLELQPNDAASIVNLGAYYFRKGDYGAAIQLFHRAAGLDGRSAVAYFNLSQAYSESYLFAEQRLALSQAREIDEARVNRWLAQSESDRVITVDVRQSRAQAILEELASSWRNQGPGMLTFRRLVSLGLPVGALLLSLVFGRLIAAAAGGGPPVEGGGVARALRWLVPGLESMAAEEGGRAFLALVFLAACVVLVFGQGLGYAVPWGISPGPALPVGLGLGGLAVFYGGRLWWVVRTSV